MDRFELSGSSPRYAWPVVVAGASAVLAGARLAGLSHDERLRDDSAGVADRLRTVAEKLETFGPSQRAFSVTVRGGRRGRRPPDRRFCRRLGCC